MSERRIKVLLAKPGLDGHDVGAKVVVQALMEAGFDVVYTGLRQTPERSRRPPSRRRRMSSACRSSRARTCRCAGASATCCRRRACYDKLWIVGGNIPEDDRMVLRQLGYRGVFPTGSRIDEIVTFIRENVK